MDEKFKGLVVYARNDEDPDRLIKRFMKKVRNDGILQELFNRRGFEKPSVKRRRKESRARFLKANEDKEV
jgi:ribosomal protein S21